MSDLTNVVLRDSFKSSRSRDAVNYIVPWSSLSSKFLRHRFEWFLLIRCHIHQVMNLAYVTLKQSSICLTCLSLSSLLQCYVFHSPKRLVSPNLASVVTKLKHNYSVKEVDKTGHSRRLFGKDVMDEKWDWMRKWDFIHLSPLSPFRFPGIYFSLARACCIDEAALIGN